MNSYKYSYSQYLYPVGLLGNRIGVCTAKWFSKTVLPNESSSCFTSLPIPGIVGLFSFSCLSGRLVLPHCDLLYFSDD